MTLRAYGVHRTEVHGHQVGPGIPEWTKRSHASGSLMRTKLKLSPKTKKIANRHKTQDFKRKTSATSHTKRLCAIEATVWSHTRRRVQDLILQSFQKSRFQKQCRSSVSGNHGHRNHSTTKCSLSEQ